MGSDKTEPTQTEYSEATQLVFQGALESIKSKVPLSAYQNLQQLLRERRIHEATEIADAIAKARASQR